MIALIIFLILNTLDVKWELQGSWGGESRREVKRGFVEDVVPDPSPDSLCCAVPAGRSPGPGKCASAHGCHFGCSARLLDWPPPGPWWLTRTPSKGQRHWHWDHMEMEPLEGLSSFPLPALYTKRPSLDASSLL